MWRFAIPLGILALLVAFFWRGLYLDPGELPSPFIDKPAPAFELPTLHNEEATLSHLDLRGRVVLFNVWATWCPGCHQEHSLLMEFAQAHDTPVYGLNWKDERAAALRWLQQTGNPYRVSAFDAEGRVAIDWGVYGAPETFVLDKRGIIRYKHIGPLTPEILYGVIVPLLAELKAET